MNLIDCEKSSIILMAQGTHIVFCYYNISEMTIKRFEKLYGKNSWKDSVPVLKVFKVNEKNSEELETIYMDPLADNWYINLKEDGIKVLVELGRVLPNNEFISLAISNQVITARNNPSDNSKIRYVNVFDNKVKQ